MINAASSNIFTNPRVLRERFQKATTEAKERDEVVDKLVNMGEALMVLDGTDADQDEAVGSVAYTDDKGIIAFAKARPFGGIMELDYLNEKKDGTVEEFSIATDMFGTMYTMNTDGQGPQIYTSGNGLLALMAEIDLKMPDRGEEPEEVEEPKESDSPKESDKPKEGEKPEGSDKPKETEKPKKSKKKKKK